MAPPGSRRQPPIIFIMGGPGSGKGTQSEKIASTYGFVHLSTGDLLREEVNSGTERGKQLNETMKSGGLVDTETVITLLKEKIESYPSNVPGFLIDGYPREPSQGVLFEERIGVPLAVIYIMVPDSVMTDRLILRGGSSGRADDNADTIKKRLVTFHEQTEPILQKYASIKYEIEGVRAVDAVFADVQAVFEKLGIKPRPTPVLVISGGPGSGKGTVSEKIVQNFGFLHLSTGDLLREEVKSGSEAGKALQEKMTSGGLVDDDAVLNLLKKKMDCNKGRAVLLDGFPRRAEQATLLEEKVCRPTAVIYLEVSDDTMTARLLNRGLTSGRADDNAETIKARLNTFHEQTDVILDMYKDRLFKINGEQSVEEVFRDVRQVFTQNLSISEIAASQ